MKRIAIRADASSKIGSGHLMRCLALADAVALTNSEVTFICRASPDNLSGMVQARGHQLTEIAVPPGNHARDAVATQAVLKNIGGVDWLVVDHYDLDARWERSQRAYAWKILAIDDLGNRPHACDILLDQNLGADLDGKYAGLVAQDTIALLGPTFALLRPQFATARRTLRPRDGAIRRVLILYGGSDAGNDTAKALDALEMLGRNDIYIDVVVGPNHPPVEALRHRLSAWPRARLLQNVDNVADLMASADLALGAGGISTWERACLALPTIATAIADNQSAGLAQMAAEGALVNLGPSAQVKAGDLAAELRRCLEAPPERLVRMGHAAAAVVDGEGCGRVAAAMLAAAPGSLRLRRAAPSDAAQLLAWRNEPEVRASSLTTHEISRAEHDAWFARKLADAASVIWIAEVDGEPAGVVRFDRTAGSAFVSIATAPATWGKGWGKRLLAAGCARAWVEFPGIEAIDAVVLKDNRRSQRLFASAGFRLADIDDDKLCYRLARPAGL